MPLLVRKIDKAKWMQNSASTSEDVSADAITNCLKTRANALSVWEVPEDSGVPDAVVAMASQFDSLDTIDVVCLCRDDVVNAGLELSSTPGNTALKGFSENHRDVVRLKYRTLGVLTDLIIARITTPAVRRYTKTQLIDLLRDAVTSGRVEITDLHEGVRRKVSGSRDGV